MNKLIIIPLVLVLAGCECGNDVKYICTAAELQALQKEVEVCGSGSSGQARACYRKLKPIYCKGSGIENEDTY